MLQNRMEVAINYRYRMIKLKKLKNILQAWKLKRCISAYGKQNFSYLLEELPKIEVVGDYSVVAALLYAVSLSETGQHVAARTYLDKIRQNIESENLFNLETRRHLLNFIDASTNPNFSKTEVHMEGVDKMIRYLFPA